MRGAAGDKPPRYRDALLSPRAWGVDRVHLMRRLRSAADFQRVRAKGYSYAHPLLVLYVHPNDGELTRFGFVISKRVGNAVVRNRAKRLLREAARRVLPALPSGWDIIVSGRPALAHAGAAVIAAALADVLRHAKLLDA